jgi:hypothetical protein
VDGRGGRTRPNTKTERKRSLYVFESPSRERLEEALAAASFGYVRVTEAAEFSERRTP